jgi:hypothetical protein
MKIHVVKDKSGKVITSFEAASETGPSVTPVLTDGSKVEEVEVASNYKDNLKVLYSA